MQDIQLKASTVQVKLEASSPRHNYGADIAVDVKRDPAQNPPMEPQPHASRWDKPEQPTEQEIQELKAKEIEARIMAELPQLRGSYGIARWEREVSYLQILSRAARLTAATACSALDPREQSPASDTPGPERGQDGWRSLG